MITHLPPLRPEWWVQLPVREQPVLQAGEELQEMPPLGEVEGWPLDPILADQHHRPAAVHCHVTGQRRPSRKSLRGMATGPPGQHVPPRPDTWTCSEALGQAWTEVQGQFHLPQAPLIPPMIMVDWKL